MRTAKILQERSYQSTAGMGCRNAMKPKLVFLIPTHDRWPSLAKAIGSIGRLKRIADYQVHTIIFDNGSTLSNPTSAITTSYGDTVHLRSDKNIFMRAKPELEKWAFSNIQLSEQDSIVHLDDDVVLSPEWLDAARVALESGFDACGSVEMRNGELTVSGQLSLDIQARIVAGVPVNVWNWKLEPVLTDFGANFPVAFAGHRALAVRASTAIKVMHDPYYLIGGEDLDYSLSLTSFGAKIGIARHALIEHRSLGESDALGFRTRDKVELSWRHFFNKWGFVRANAGNEAGLAELDWLKLFLSGDNVIPFEIPSEQITVKQKYHSPNTNIARAMP